MNSLAPIYLLGTACLLLMSCHPGTSEDVCKTIDTAFRHDGSFFLVSGEDYYELGSDMREVQTGKLATRFDGTPHPLTAATVWTGDDTLYLFAGTKYYYYSTWFDHTFGPYRNSRWTPFFIDGIDAAGKLEGKNYFFRGCEHVVYSDDAYSAARANHDLGLPCDVDAAWDQGEVMVVAKGAQSWAVDADEKVRGPVLLSSQVSLTSASLCETEHAADWVSRLKQELAYEKEHGCVVLDAALNYEDTVYLFNNDSYVRLDEDGKEDRISKMYDWGGLGFAIDAALKIDHRSKSYFFQGDQYFAYYGLSFGPFSSAHDWTSFFSDGVDAAGSRHGVTYFFQGCRVAEFDPVEEKVTGIHDLEEVGLPCDVNAAVTKGDELYVIKGDLVWIWGQDVHGPGPLSELFQLTSWNICSP